MPTKIPVLSDLRFCTRCGRCVPLCPTYQILKNEVFSPRGRIFLYQNQVYHSVSFESCILCGTCDRICPNKVGFVQACLEFHKTKEPKSYVLEGILYSVTSHPLSWLTGFKLKGKRANQREFSQEVSFEESDLTVYYSCDVRYFYPSVIDVFLRLVGKEGIRVYIVEESNCCGAHFLSLGLGSLVKRQALKNLEIFKRGSKPLVHFCATCFWMFKRVYPAFFKNTPYERDFLDLSQRSLSILYVLNEKTPHFWDRLKEVTKNKNILFHLPCHLTEDILLVKNRIEAINFCCGSPKLFLNSKTRKYREVFKKNWFSFLERKNYLVTLCAGCYFNFKTLLKKPPHIKHWLEVL